MRSSISQLKRFKYIVDEGRILCVDHNISSRTEVLLDEPHQALFILNLHQRALRRTLDNSSIIDRIKFETKP
jgi:hypothetical protein